MAIIDFYNQYIDNLPKSNLELIIKDLRLIKTDEITKQYEQITDIAIKYSLNWDMMMKLEETGYIRYDEEYECFVLGDKYD